MGLKFPSTPPQDGDDETISPQSNSRSLLAADQFGNTRRILVDTDRAVYVHVLHDSSGDTGFDNTVNSYSETLVPFATVTTILTYSVPLGQTFHITEVIGWGDTNGEFLVKVNNITKGGGRTTAATPNFIGDYVMAPIIASAGDTVTITAEHYNPSARTMKANLLAGIS